MRFKSIRTSLIIVFATVIVICSVAVQLITFRGMKQVSKSSNASYKKAVVAGYKAQIKGEVDAMLTLINMEYDKYKAGEITEEEAQDKAKEILRNTRYGDNDEGYFWIDDTDCNLVMHPILKEKEGTNRRNLKDKNGVMILQNIVKTAQSGGGYNEFHFTKADGKTVAPKLAYSEEFEPWGWIVTTGNYIDKMQKDIAHNHGNLYNIQQRMIWQIIITSLTLTVLAILICFFYVGNIKKYLLQMQDMVAAIARGDLTQNVARKGKNELAVLAGSLNESQQGIHGLVSEVNTTSEKLLNVQERFVENYETMEASVENLAKAMEDIAGNVSKQAASTAEAADSVEKIGDNIHNASKELDNLNENATVVQDCSEKSVTSMQKMLKVNEQTMQDIKVMYTQTEHTNASVEKISKAATLISEIAAQTNLLSLNASIEAARAGESGKGFAVVAGEIGELAIQSANTVQEINTIIHELTENSAKSMDIMKNMNASSKTQIDTVAVTQDTFTQLKNALELCMHAIVDIAQTVQEIDKQKDFVVGYIDDLNALSSNNAAFTEETSATSEEIENTVKDSLTILEDVNQNIQSLITQVHHFKI